MYIVITKYTKAKQKLCNIYKMEISNISDEDDYLKNKIKYSRDYINSDIEHRIFETGKLKDCINNQSLRYLQQKKKIDVTKLDLLAVLLNGHITTVSKMKEQKVLLTNIQKLLLLFTKKALQVMPNIVYVVYSMHYIVDFLEKPKMTEMSIANIDYAIADILC